MTDPRVKLVYFKLSGKLPLTFISYLYTEKQFFEITTEYKLIMGLFYGFMGALCLYNLFLYFSIKEKMYLYYVLYMVSFLFYQGTMNTLDLELYGSTVPGWILERSIPFVYHILNICMIAFSREFLATKQMLPKLDRFLSVLSILSLFSLILVYLLPEPFMADYMALTLGFVSPICLWVTGWLVLLKGIRTARLYLIGWSILLVSIISQVFTLTGVLDFHPIFLEGIPGVAAALEAVILSFALADRINILKKQRVEEQRILSEKLEFMVVERTKNLEEVNAKLLRLSTIDSLTQLYNRYQIEQFLKHKMLEAEHKGSSLAVILMDIDHFKQVNDQHGHIAGDKVLRSIAKLLKKTLRDTDIVGRWGGEEFMLICPNTLLDEAFKIADRLRQTIEEHTFPIVQKQTASFGISCFKQGDDVKHLVSRADQALYQAKQKGRNRVEIKLHVTA